MRYVQSALSSARARSRGHEVTAPSRPRTKLALARRRVQTNCSLSPQSLVRKLPGRMTGRTCEIWSNITTAQCVMYCLGRQECSVVSLRCEAGPCRCTACRGVVDIVHGSLSHRPTFSLCDKFTNY
ncbi:hypothetical protein ElyMa_006302100 [Elysia marginata]|uniref:Uncharacterized protein n=1 Tax=Elysia marginata TaxID=1093978 RepID=A0AAV4HEJ8_9GAST|nr:hypothetical protein ElyMa_006302100 [Elysia marginata]